MIDQSAFVNMSIFDHEYLDALFGGMKYPDGTAVIDYLDEIIEHQKIFMEVAGKIRNSNMFTFPVFTYSLLKRDDLTEEEIQEMLKTKDYRVFVDNEFARWCSDHNMLWNDSNFFMSENVNSLSNCCFGGMQRCLVKNEDGTILYIEFKDLYNRITKNNSKEYKIFHKGEWKKGNIIRVKRDRNVYMVSTKNGQRAIVTDNHIFPTLNGDKQVSELTIRDSLKINNIALPVDPDLDPSEYLTFEDGVKLGEYIIAKYIDRYNTDKELPENLKDYYSEKYNSFIDNVLHQTIEFRKGILEGLRDHSEEEKFIVKGIYHIDNYVLIDKLRVLISSIGKTYDILDRGVLQVLNSIGSSGIVEIAKIPNYTDEYVYCFEMDDQEDPYFTLSNGIITHNCRLLSDTSKLDAFVNSIGGTALSIGSVKVNTINLMRCAYESQGNPLKFYKILEKRAELACKTLEINRHIIKRNIEKHLLPNYDDGAIEMSKQYSTIGIIGLYEVIEYFKGIKRDEFGGVEYTEDGMEMSTTIFKILNDVKDNFTDEYSINIESVPGERCAVVLCQKDNILFDKHEKDIYSNQWIPLTEKCSINEKLRVSSELDAKCSGGAIAHINLESNFPDAESAWDMLNKIALSGVIYFAFNTRINVCEHQHGFVGTDHCPKCGLPVYDTFQRIVGYLIPTRAYSKDRFKEFTARRWYNYALELKD